MKSIVILASGQGSNASQIISHFEGGSAAKVLALISDKAECGALDKAAQAGVDTYSIPYKEMVNGELLRCLDELKPSLIVLAGFLRKIPESVILNYPEKIINVHPSLLPNYGGKGMYGMNVHDSVIQGQETESGITIHFVNKEFDKGRRIAQFFVAIEEGETGKSLQKKIHHLEHSYLPLVIEKTLDL